MQAVKHYLDKGERMPCPEKLAPEFQKKAGTFVTIRHKGQLRGCIGTLTPGENNLAAEIIRNALQAGFNDPRFPPVTREEWADLTFAVEVVSPPVKVENPSYLDPKIFGLVVRNNGHQGVLLPGVEGVDTVDEQIRICRLKGKISKDAPVELFRFQVKSYH